jgi:hypothetical protein
MHRTNNLLLVDLRLRTHLERRIVEALKGAAPQWLELSLTLTGPASSRLDSLQRYVLTGEFAPQRDPNNSVPVFSASGEPLSALKSRAAFFGLLPAACASMR